MKAARRSAFRSWSAPALALLLLCAAGLARAQDVEPIKQHDFAVNAGVFIPTNGTLRDQSSDMWWHVGVDYYPHFRTRPLNGDVTFGVDFNWRDSGARTYFSIPLSAKIRWDLAPESRIRPYAGLGAGLYFINTGYIGATTQAGAKFFVGVDLSERLFVEVNYDYVSGFSDNLGNSVRVDGLTAALGAKF